MGRIAEAIRQDPDLSGVWFTVGDDDVYLVPTVAALEEDE